MNAGQHRRDASRDTVDFIARCIAMWFRLLCSFVSIPTVRQYCFIELAVKGLQMTRVWLARLILMITLSRHEVLGTIDVNLNELEYLAARLNPFECRRLIAALHYNTYDLPDSLAGAERNVDDEIPCFRHLLHWNSAPLEGRGKTHEVLTHRLRQINRNDLADWLGQSAFTQLRKDLGRAMAKPFGELGKEETELPYPITLEPAGKREEDEAWLQVDIVLVAIMIGLLATLSTLICAAIFQRIRQHFRTIKYKKLKQREIQNANQEMGEKRTETKYCTQSNSEATDCSHAGSDTDTDYD